MFWKFNIITSPHIDTLLNREDVTLQELMNEEDILQECKVQNKKLIDFLVQPEVMEEMVNLIISEPNIELDEKFKYKYSNIACELLTCDVPAISEKVASDEDLLNKLYSFLENEKPLNPLLASFFSKIIGVLITRKPEQNWYSYQFACLQVLEFLKGKEECVNLLLKHLGTSAVMDLLLRLITCVEAVELKQNVLNWLNNQQVIQRLVALMDPSVDAERHYNASQLLCDIIRFSGESQLQGPEKVEPDPLLGALQSGEPVKEMLNHMFSGEKSESCIVSGISVLLALLDVSKPSIPGQEIYCRNDVQDGPSSQELERQQQGVHNTIRAIIARLKDLHQLLQDPPLKPPMKTTVGLLEQPLGTTRLFVAKLVSALVATNSPEVNQELATLGTVDALLDLFVKYSWNNFLHTQVEHCIGLALNSEPAEGEDGKQHHVLLTHIFTKCRIVQRILALWEENEEEQSKPGCHRRGYMGHLARIANHIVDCSENGSCGDLIKEQIRQLPEDICTKWDSFVSNTLAEVNKKNQIILGGAHPSQSNVEDNDSEFRDIPFPQDTALQQIFSDYQMQQMSQDFIDQFGFNDDEFTDGEDALHAGMKRLTNVSFNVTPEEQARQAKLFEQVCSQRITAFGENEGDIWDDKEQELTFGAVIESRPRIQRSGNSSLEESNSSDEEETAGKETAESGGCSVPETGARSRSGQEEVKMEVDQNDPWATFDSPNSEVAPVAMDTTGNPWEVSSSNTTTSSAVSRVSVPAGPQAGWADFSNADFGSSDFGNSSSTDFSTSSADFSGSGNAGFGSDNNFADFEANFASNFTSNSECVNIGSVNTVAMEVNEGSAVSDPSRKYLAEDSPSSAEKDSNTTPEVGASDSAGDAAPVTPPEVSANPSTGEPAEGTDSTAVFNSKSSLQPCSHTSTPDRLETDTVPRPISPMNVEEIKDSSVAVQDDNASNSSPLVSKKKGEEEDLAVNFSFLASRGLVKTGEEEDSVSSSAATVDHTPLLQSQENGPVLGQQLELSTKVQSSSSQEPKPKLLDDSSSSQTTPVQNGPV